MAAHAAFLRHRYSEAAALYTACLEGGGELSTLDRCLLHCNRGAAYTEMDLHRKALKDAEAALALDTNCLRAMLLKGASLRAMGREEDAIRTWSAGAAMNVGDVLLVAEMTQLAKGGPAAAPQAAAAATSCAAVVAAAAAPAAASVVAAAPAAVAAAPSSTPSLAPDSRPASSASSSTPPPPPPPPPPIAGATVAPPTSTTQADAAPAAKPSAAAKSKPIAPPAQGASEPAAPRPPKGGAEAAAAAQGALVSLRRAVTAANEGDYRAAVELFTQVLSYEPGLTDALSGRGTSYAYLGDLPKALRDFDAALRHNPKDPDLLGRRVQVLQALGGRDAEVVEATTAILSARPHEVQALHQRGKAFSTLQNYRRAVADLTAFLDRGGKRSAAVLNLLGTSLAAMGRCTSAIDAYQQTLTLDPALHQAHVNLGQAHRDLAQVDDAEREFSRAIAIKADFVPSRHRRALLRHAVGDHARAAEDLEVACQLEPGFSEARGLLAMCHVALGRFRRALSEFDAVLEREPRHPAAHHRAALLMLMTRLDEPRDEHPLDSIVPADVKHGACKLLPAETSTEALHSALAARAKGRQTGSAAFHVEQLLKRVGDVGAPGASPARPGAAALLRACAPFAERMQVRLPGFVPNARLQRQAGLAVLEIAQRVRRLLHGAGPVLPGWRAIYDVAVRWRQLGEPNDYVYWIDGLPRADFEEGFGSHTPILKGQHETVRYFRHYNKVFERLRDYAPEQWKLDDEAASKARRCSDCLELRRLRGQDDYVVSPCQGKVSGTLEGTRLTIQDRPPDGVEVSIRTPLTPSRWAAYEPEMQAAWEAYCDVAAAAARASQGDGPAGPPPSPALLDAVLRLAFYWFNFMPLTRGSAATGWAMCMGLLLACDYEVTSPMPESVSLDWEAILTPALEDFVRAHRPWLAKACARRPADATVDKLPAVGEVFGTYRGMLEALTAPYHN